MIPPDLGPTFARELVAIASRVEADPVDLASVWKNESGVTSTAHNPHGHASGLFQAMPETLRGMGFRGVKELEPQGAYMRAMAAERLALATGDERALAAARAEKERLNDVLGREFRTLSAVQQLPWAERYYAPHRGKLVNAAACYVATFLPADLELAADSEAVLSQKGGRRGWAFALNASFDANHDYRITVGELEQAIERACVGARWAAIRDALRAELGLGPAEPVPEPRAYVLGTWLGVQEALAAVGFDPGKLDGIPGPRSVAALKLFQLSRKLRPDGIPGPLTRRALADAVYPPGAA